MPKFIFDYPIAILVVFDLLACGWVYFDGEAISWVIDLGLVVFVFADELAFVVFE